MNIESAKFHIEMGEMKKSMHDFEKRLYGIILNGGANTSDLDILLTLTYAVGKNAGVNLARETINATDINMD